MTKPQDTGPLAALYETDAQTPGTRPLAADPEEVYAGSEFGTRGGFEFVAGGLGGADGLGDADRLGDAGNASDSDGARDDRHAGLAGTENVPAASVEPLVPAGTFSVPLLPGTDFEAIVSSAAF